MRAAMPDNLIKGMGTSWEIQPGVYQYRFNMGKDPSTGKYRYSPKRTLHCKTKNKRGREAELREAMEQYKQELIAGIAPLKSSRQTVGEYASSFHELRRGTMGSELSWKREELEIAHIKELFGDINLVQLDAMAIKTAYANARKNKRFSESTLHKIHVTLSQIMKEALVDDLISKNPCETISVPRPKAKEREALSVEEASRLLECLLSEELNSHIMGALLLLDTGMRRGEMLGLTWKYVDLEKGTVFIAQQFAKDKTLRSPKSKTSQRCIHLSDGMVDILKKWQQKQRNFMGLQAKKPLDSTPVVNNELCEHMDPDHFNRWFRDWCVDHEFGTFSNEPEIYYDTAGRKRVRKSGYSGLTPHMLRHTQATLLISNGIDIKTVQSRLGHSTVNLTLNIYSHAVAANDQAAANSFGDLLRKKSAV
jgi:integrase